MEQRVRHLEAAYGGASLDALCREAASAYGLDPGVVLVEAERIAAEWDGLSLPQIADRLGISMAELEDMARDLMAGIAGKADA